MGLMSMWNFDFLLLFSLYRRRVSALGGFFGDALNGWIRLLSTALPSFKSASCKDASSPERKVFAFFLSSFLVIGLLVLLLPNVSFGSVFGVFF